MPIKIKIIFLKLFFILIPTLRAALSPGERAYVMLPNLMQDGKGDISLNLLLARSFIQQHHPVTLLVPEDSLSAYRKLIGNSKELSNHIVLKEENAHQIPEGTALYSINTYITQKSFAPWLAKRIDFKKSILLKEKATPWPFPTYFTLPTISRESLATRYFRGKLSKKIATDSIDIAMAIIGRNHQKEILTIEEESVLTLRAYAKAIKKKATLAKRPTLLLYRKFTTANADLSDLNDAFFTTAEIPFLPIEAMGQLLSLLRHPPFITSGALLPLSLAAGQVPIVHLRIHYRNQWLDFLKSFPGNISDSMHERALTIKHEAMLSWTFLQTQWRFRESFAQIEALAKSNHSNPELWERLLSLENSQLKSAINALSSARPNFYEFLDDLKRMSDDTEPKTEEAFQLVASLIRMAIDQNAVYDLTRNSIAMNGTCEDAVHVRVHPNNPN